MIRLILITLACIAPFVAPYPLALVLSFCGALAFPPTALVAGILTDALYYLPGTFPTATLVGGVLSCIAVVSTRLVRAHLFAV